MSGSRIPMGVFALVALSLAMAGSVSAADVAELGKSLTPIGAERAGNVEGTIPEWTGGDVKPVKGWQPGDVRVDP